MKGTICFDIGGTSVKYALVNEQGIHEQNSFFTDRSDSRKVLASMTEKITGFLKEHDVDGIGISSPGFVDSRTGKILSGNIIEGMNGMNLRDYFSERFDLPVAVENDANCAAIAEHQLGNGRGYENLAVITLGTGVGGGLIIHNKIYSGNRSMAGEFGFSFIHGIHTDQPENSIWSDHASMRALTEKVQKETGEHLDGPAIFERSQSDPVLTRILSDFYDSLAMGIHNICYTVAPQAILIGGGVSRQSGLTDEIKKRLSALKPSFSVDLNEVTDLKPCLFFNDSGLLGAYCSVQNLISKQ